MRIIVHLGRHCCLAACAFGLSGHAQGILVDQQNDARSPYSLALWTLRVGYPVGQEFVPQFSSLDFVDLVTASVEVDSDATFQIAIHRAEITGSVVGTSAQVFGYAETGPSIMYFKFPSTVPLTAGDTYVLELLYEPSRWTLGADVLGGYAAGQMIRGGIPFDGEDLWFREGIVVPEPSAFGLLAVGGAAITVARRRIYGR